jgi:D-alanyl-lipoteichoic acid acyltransferase DltB (MBOAT superfamily)
LLFNSYIFLFAFLPLTLCGFALCRGRSPRAVVWLLATSIAFYGWWEPAYLPLLIASILVNHALARGLALQPAGRRRGRGALLALGIAFNLGLLGWFKYAGFFAANLNPLLGTSWQLDIVLPLAISFFTFQQIAYLVDVARGGTAERSFATYALFVSFFPQLIAGPIVRREEILPQLRRERWRLDPTDLGCGLFIFGVGLSKKVIVADGVAPSATAVFEAAERGVALTFVEAWLGALAYSVQIYFDFSGYSDMAVGLGRMFGIRLPLNFNSPYQAGSIADFWRRWHMTLSRFLRDYLYLPLGGNRRGAARRYLNLMATMLLGGLWHGAAWTFVVWGGLHGLYLVVNHTWRALGWRWTGRPAWLGRFAAWLLTFAAVTFAWVFFRATSLSGALVMVEAMAGGNGIALPTEVRFLQPWLAPLGIGFDGMLRHGLLAGWSAAAGIALGLLIAWTAPNVYQLLPAQLRPLDVYAAAAARRPALRWRPIWQWGIVTGLLLGIGILGVSDENEFLYFNF